MILIVASLTEYALCTCSLQRNRDSNHFAGAIDEVAVFDRALTGDEITAAYGVVHLGLPQAGLIAYWTFDEGVGRQSADKSGFGNHAILRRGTQWYLAPDASLACPSLPDDAMPRLLNTAVAATNRRLLSKILPMWT